MFSWMTATDFPAVKAYDEVEEVVHNRPSFDDLSDNELILRMRHAPLFAKIFSTHSEVSAAASVTLGAITGMALGVGRPGLDLRIAGGLGGVASSEPSFAMWDLSRMVRSSDELSNEMDKGAENFKQNLKY